MAEQEERVRVEFHPVPGLTGLDVREGELHNDEGDFVVRAVGVGTEAQSAELNTVLDDLRISVAIVDDVESPVEDDEESDIQVLIDEVSQERAHIAFDVKPTATAHNSLLVAVYETTIAAGWVHWYRAVPVTAVTVLGGKVRFRRPNKDPITLTRSDGRVARATPNGSSIRGVHQPRSRYVIEGPGKPTGVGRAGPG
jgi:hypothetical protein